MAKLIYISRNFSKSKRLFDNSVYFKPCFGAIRELLLEKWLSYYNWKCMGYSVLRL